MAVDETLVGRSFRVPAPYEVTRERVEEFARATGSAYDGGAAPATFPIVVAFRAIDALIEDPGLGIALHRLVHGEQRFTYARPVEAGDRLDAELTVESVRRMAGADIIATRTEITDAEGRAVCTAFATLLHRGEDG